MPGDFPDGVSDTASALLLNKSGSYDYDRREC